MVGVTEGDGMKKFLAPIIRGVSIIILLNSSLNAAATRSILSDGQRAQRRTDAQCIRITAANDQHTPNIAAQPNNGDETLYADRRGNHAKGLLHNNDGHVNTAAYNTLLTALASTNPSDFNNITMGGTRKLTDPQAGYSFSLEGDDAAINVVPPAPAFASAEAAGEMVENYWHALLRDIPFNKYDSDPLAADAMADLNGLSDFRGPKVGGEVRPRTLFRLDIPGACKGPHISQFLYLPIPNLGHTSLQESRYPLPGVQNDFLTDTTEWLTVHNGGVLNRSIQFSATPSFIKTGRDLGDWVHLDYPGQGFFQAALILLGFGPAALDDNHPYKNNATQADFVSYGIVDLLNLVCGVTQSVMKAVWYQKWMVHRRLRPEEFAFLVNKQISDPTNFGIHADLLNSQALVKTFEKYGNYLLSQQYPEGCPTHPSYPCGHGSISAACATLLKAWFKEDFVIPNPVKPNANNTALVDCLLPLTVGGELNKLCSNIAKGRDMAGVHYRSDCNAALELGEAIAIAILEDEAYTKNINFSGFSLTKFDGTVITVGAKKAIPSC